MDFLENAIEEIKRFEVNTSKVQTNSFIFLLQNQINDIDKIIQSKITNDKKLLSSNINNYFGKITTTLNSILSHKLSNNKKNKSVDNNIHYWNYVRTTFPEYDTVKFITLRYNEKTDIDKTAMTWICISLLEKSFYTFIHELYKKGLSTKFYLEDSIINENRNEILEISKKLMSLNIYVTFKVYDEYKEYLSSLKALNSKELIPKQNKKIVHRNNSISSFSLNSADSNIQFNSNYVNDRDKDDEPNTDKLLNLIHKTTEDIVYSYKNFETGNLIDDICEKNLNSKTNVFLINLGSKKQETTQILQQSSYEYIITKFLDFEIKENFFDFNNIKEPHHAFIPINYEKNIYNKNFEIVRKFDQNKYTKKDVIKLDKKVIKLTNSIIFYLNNYYTKQSYFEFNTKLLSKPLTLDEQNYQCQFCLKKFNSYLSFPSDEVFWCSYFMKYVCDDCFGDDYSSIPAFILKFWDFSKFPISKKAKNLLQQWFTKPLINLKSDDKLIPKSKELRNCILLKKKLHRIFDYLKCESAELIAVEILGEYKYLVLIENVFSLQDLCEISEGTFFNKLSDFIILFENHITMECISCEYKGRPCMICKNQEILNFHDVEKVFYCKFCDVIYHKDCSFVHNCLIES